MKCVSFQCTCQKVTKYLKNQTNTKTIYSHHEQSSFAGAQGWINSSHRILLPLKMPTLFLNKELCMKTIFASWKAGREAGLSPGKWCSAPGAVPQMFCTLRSCLTGHQGLCWAPEPQFGMKAAIKKKIYIYIFARERRKLRQLIHAPRLFQVFHFNQAAILPDFCFEHTLDSFCYLWKA